MAIPFLSDIKLNGNQIKELVVDHKSGSQPTTGYHGQLIFRTDQNKVYVNTSTTANSPSWESIAGDIKEVVAGSGLTGGGNIDDVTLNIGTGDGITVSADKISVTVDDSTIELSASDNSGAVRIKDSGVVAAKIGSGAVETVKIADNAVTLAKLAHQTNDTVFKVNGSGVPTAGTIDTANISADAVTSAKIGDDQINSEHIATGAIDLDHMSANSVDSDQYVDGSIDTAHIGNDQVTYAKVQNVAANNVLLGNVAGADSVIAELTANDLTALIKDVLNNNMGTVTIGDSNDTVAIPGDLQVTGKTTTNNVEVVSTSNGVVFEGTVADEHDATLLSVVADSDKTYTLPNITGYVPILTNDPGTTAISATVAEINKIDGFTGDHNDLNYAKDLRATGVTTTEYDTLDGITASTTELNIMDGDTSATSTSLVDADRVVVNDNGTMKQVAFSDVATYIEAQITSRELTVELDANESVVTKSGNVYTVTHSFGTRNVLCQVIEDNSNSTDGSYQTVMVDVDRASDSTVEVDFGQSVTDGHYRILIHKIG